MNKKNIITVLLALVTLAGQAQEARIDTIVPRQNKCTHENPPSLFTMLKSAGRFIFIR